MRRKAHHNLWTLILTLLLCGASTVSMPRNVRADLYPVDPAPPAPPPPQAGDPDWPSQGGRMPKPGPSRGTNQPAGPRDLASARKDRLGAWMWNVRMVFVAAFRVFFRF